MRRDYTPITDRNVEWLMHQDGSRRLMVEGHMLCIKKQFPDITFWKCAKNIKCTVIAHTVGDDLIKYINSHCHELDPKYSLARKAIAIATQLSVEHIHWTDHDVSKTDSDIRLIFQYSNRFITKWWLG